MFEESYIRNSPDCTYLRLEWSIPTGIDADAAAGADQRAVRKLSMRIIIPFVPNDSICPSYE